jgi:hypothetical protein
LPAIFFSGVAGSAAASERGVEAGVGVAAGVHTGCAQITEEENNARKKWVKVSWLTN